MPRLTGNPVDGDFTYVDYSVSQNYANNTSTISWTVGWAFRSPSPLDRDLDNGSLTMDGTSRWSSANPYNYTGNFAVRDLNLSSGSFTVTHDAAGNRSISVSASITGWQNKVSSFSTTVTLARIPKPPAAPTPIGLDQITPTSMRYQFTPGDNNGATITQHEVQWSTSNTFTSPTSSLGTSTAVTASSLANHTTYYFRSRSQNSQGWGAWSTTTSAATTGHPTAPLNLSALASTTVTGRNNLTWDAPSTPGAGGIVGYTIYRDGVQIATTTGTGTTYSDTGRTPYVVHSYTVAGRNAYSTSVGGVGPQSVASVVTTQGPPSAPSGLTAVADVLNPGNIDLSWTAPAQTGNGGITGYTVYFSNGTVIQTLIGTGTTYTVTGLSPGLTYSFYVRARNALADAEGSLSAQSNTATETALGEPDAPTSLTVVPDSTSPTRLVLSWTAPAGSVTGYSILEIVSGIETFVASVSDSITSYKIAGISAGTTKTYTVKARNVYTDTLTPPASWGGPSSNQASGTTTNDFSQSVPTLAALTNSTNTDFNGTYTVSAITATTIRYAKTATAVSTVSVPSGSVANNTNATFNGTYVIATPTPTTLTYSKTATNIASASVVFGTLTNTTNQSFNGVKTITAVNVGANTITYARSGSAVGSVSVPTNTAPGAFGTVENQTNVVYNGTDIEILSVPSDTTFTYAVTNANLPESNAAGTATNVTNRDIFNGTYEIISLPAYNKVVYSKTADDIALVAVSGASGGAIRETSPAKLHIKHRPGWAG